MSGGSQQTGKTTNTNEPWSEAKPYYKTLFQGGSDAFNANKNQGWTGDFTSPENQVQKDALAGTLGSAGGQNAGYMDFRNLGLKTIRGDFLDPSSNPALAGMLTAAQNPITQQFREQVLPGIADAAEQGGAYGGARMGLAQATAAREYGTATADSTNKILYDNYQRERQNQLAAGQLFDTANQLQLRPYQVMGQVGDAQQGFDQSALDNSRSKFLELQNAKWNGLDKLAALLGTGGFSNSSQVTSKPTGGVGGALQGLMGGAAAGAQLGSIIPGLGTGIGAIGGGLLGGLTGGFF